LPNPFKVEGVSHSKYVKLVSLKLYIMDEVTVQLTWDELKAVLAAVKYVTRQVDSDKLEEAYIKLSTQYKGV
jgi:hypothetical protein